MPPVPVEVAAVCKLSVLLGGLNDSGSCLMAMVSLTTVLSSLIEKAAFFLLPA